MKLNEGDKVKLVTSGWGDNQNNPVWGGKHGKTVGVIIEKFFDEDLYGEDGGDHFPYDVKWKDGHTNEYRIGDIELITKPIQLPEDLFVI